MWVNGSDGIAAVSVADTVATGTYDIVAVSDTYSGYVKGTEIAVTNLKYDYTPAGDGNLITAYPTEYALRVGDAYKHFDDSICAINDFEHRDHLFEVPLRCITR